MKTLAISLTGVVFLFCAHAAGQDCSRPEACYGSPDRCCRCGTCCPCFRYSVIVRETKTVTKHRWACPWKDIGVPRPTFEKLLPGGYTSTDGCWGAGCAGGDCQAVGCSGENCEPMPRCGKIYPARRLMKQEYTVEVPVYKCIVLYRCADCREADAGDREEGPAEPAGSVPPPPQPIRAARWPFQWESTAPAALLHRHKGRSSSHL